MKNFLKISLLLLLPVLSANTLAAAGDIKLTTVAEVEVTVANAQGKEEVKRVPAKKVIPGTVVVYTITASNTGKQDVEAVVVTDPIPENMVYVDGSVFGAGTNITFSVDGGKNYDVAEKLVVQDAKGQSRPAMAENYTHIRWLFNFALKPGESAPVWFKARLK